MSSDDRIEEAVFEPHEFSLPAEAGPTVEKALNHEEITFVFEAPDASCCTFLTLKTDGTWEAAQA